MRHTLPIFLLLSTVIMTSALPSHAGWVSEDVLADNHRAYCNDQLSQNTSKNSGSQIQNDSGSQKRSTTRNHNESSQNSNSSKRGAGGSFMGVGAQAQEQKQSSNAKKVSEAAIDSSESFWDKGSRSTWEKTTITTHVNEQGDCSTFIQGATQIEIAEINAETERMAIQSQKDLKREEMNKADRQSRMNMILKMSLPSQ